MPLCQEAQGKELPPSRPAASKAHQEPCILLSNPMSSPTTKKTSSYELVFFVVGEDGFERRLLASVQWTLATAVASPQRSESVCLDTNVFSNYNDNRSSTSGFTHIAGPGD